MLGGGLARKLARKAVAAAVAAGAALAERHSFPNVDLTGAAVSSRSPLDQQLREFLTMLRWALIFLVLALIAGALGAGGIAGLSMNIAYVLFVIFLILLVVHFFQGRRGTRI